MQSNLEGVVRELSDRVESLENSLYSMQKSSSSMFDGFVEYRLNINKNLSDSVNVTLGTLSLIDSEVELLIVYQAVSNVAIDTLLYAGAKAIGCGRLYASPINSINYVYTKAASGGVLDLLFSQTGLQGHIGDFRIFVRGKAKFTAKV